MLGNYPAKRRQQMNENKLLNFDVCDHPNAEQILDCLAIFILISCTLSHSQSVCQTNPSLNNYLHNLSTSLLFIIPACSQATVNTVHMYRPATTTHVCTLLTSGSSTLGLQEGASEDDFSFWK